VPWSPAFLPWSQFVPWTPVFGGAAKHGPPEDSRLKASISKLIHGLAAAAPNRV